MIAVETNVLAYAHKSGSPWHAQAVRALGELMSAGAPWAIPWPCLHEFYGIVTHPKVYSPQSTSAEALDQVDVWVQGGAVFVGEAPDHLARVRQLVTDGHVINGMVHDAKIAAICLSHGVSELWTSDRDFSRFPALRTSNPLVGRTPE